MSLSDGCANVDMLNFNVLDSELFSFVFICFALAVV